jgi:hypothetical protein
MRSRQVEFDVIERRDANDFALRATGVAWKY